MSPNKLHASYQGALVGLGNDSPSFSPNWGTRVGLGDGSLVSISSYQGAWVGLGDGSLVSTSSYQGAWVGLGDGSLVSTSSYQGACVGLGDGSLVSNWSYEGAWVGLGDGSLVSTWSYEGDGVGIGVGSPVSVVSLKRFVSKSTFGRRMKSEVGSKVSLVVHNTCNYSSYLLLNIVVYCKFLGHLPRSRSIESIQSRSF